MAPSPLQRPCHGCIPHFWRPQTCPKTAVVTWAALAVWHRVGGHCQVAVLAFDQRRGWFGLGELTLALFNWHTLMDGGWF